MGHLLWHEHRGSHIRYRVGDRLRAGKIRRIQIVTKIEPDRTDWSTVAQTDPDGMGNVVVVAQVGGALLLAELRVLLSPAQQVMQHVMPGVKHVPCILKHREAEVVAE